jgi:hypothetical protein
VLIAPGASGFQVSVHPSASVTLIGSIVDPTPAHTALKELRLVRPILAGRLDWTGGFASGVLNLEGVTIPEGELSAGNWGEGFVDRRHPHTYLHELVAGVARHWHCRLDPCGVAVIAGKGFVAFGSDDPMTRATARFPVNHHWAQILERLLITGQLGVGPLLLEGSVFNGDEPERPSQLPRWSRFGDSWSLRASLGLHRDLRASGSIARVASPEHRPGAGSTHRKTHLGLRYQHPDGTRAALVEWAKTSELDGFFEFHSFLAEGAWSLGRATVSYRYERTDRPEEERVSAFRTRRPHLENSLLGITRWTLHTAGVAIHGGTLRRLAKVPIEIDPFLEATIGRVVEKGPGIFRVVDQYGGNRVRSLSVGIRVGWRMRGHRMGEYGLAKPVMSNQHPGGAR